MTLHRTLIRRRKMGGLGHVKLTTRPAKVTKAINAMTNWQRSQWAKAGYRDRDAVKFAKLERSA